MADETNPPGPSGPEEIHRDHGYQPSIPTRYVTRLVSSGVVACGAAATMDEEEENTSAPASVGLPLKRHNLLQTKSTIAVVTVAAAVVVVGIAAGRFPVGKGAAGESPPLQSVVSPSQQSLVSDSNIVMLPDRSLRDKGLTSNIADLLPTLTGRGQLTPPESSNLRVGSSVPSAPSMSMSANTRVTMSDFGAVSN